MNGYALQHISVPLLHKPQVQHQRQALDPRAALPALALRQGRQIGHVLRRRGKLLLMEQHIVGTEEDILHHHVFVPLALGIRWQAVCIDRQHLFPIDRKVGRLAALRPRLGLTPFLFRGMVLAGRWWCMGLDRGCTLLPLESVDLVTQALVLCLGVAKPGSRSRRRTRVDAQPSSVVNYNVLPRVRSHVHVAAPPIVSVAVARASASVARMSAPAGRACPTAPSTASERLW